MSEDRKMGLMWGVLIGVSTATSIFIHPIMLSFAIFGGIACWFFGQKVRA